MKRPFSPSLVLGVAGVVAFVALLAYGLSANESDSTIEDALKRGERPAAPEFELPRLEDDGEESSLRDYRGEVVVLNFWASWCPPCKNEAPVLARWQPRLAKQNSTIVGVDVLDVSSDAQRFIDEHDLDFPQLRDQDGSRLKSFEIVGYPETIVLDRKGRIAATSRGTVDEKFFVQKVQPLLKEPA